MIFFNILIDSFANLASILGIFVIFGFIFNVIENKNNQLIQRSLGEKFIIFTGFIGTVVHEVSHLIMALIFNHKIVKIELFRPRKYKEDGILGFVRSTYNPNSIYQQVGNFFIGIAPMILGTLTIWLLFIIFSNNIYTMFLNYMNIGLYTNYLQSSNYSGFFDLLGHDVFLLLKTIFSFDYIFNVNHLIMLFLIYSISTHMTLSLADLKGSFKGLLVCFIVVFVITFLGKILGVSNIFTSSIVFKINLYIFLFLMLGLFFSLLTIFISFIINIVKNEYLLNFRK
ncbi:hypothetical protein H8891_06995 [Paeniclostridium sp. NSJ-45]|uniref:Integral membrane protein n=1 Tax=Paeniclostridium hominis TaxID=2764329 RepID=A0ABR7K3V4_9FIRM|nr:MULTISPECIES: hypothetical protein [Paeniclostridium]MBC6003544.1 hypothetical protein [Paeniclostridium hominis]